MENIILEFFQWFISGQVNFICWKWKNLLQWFHSSGTFWFVVTAWDLRPLGDWMKDNNKYHSI